MSESLTGIVQTLLISATQMVLRWQQSLMWPWWVLQHNAYTCCTVWSCQRGMQASPMASRQATDIQLLLCTSCLHAVGYCCVEDVNTTYAYCSFNEATGVVLFANMHCCCQSKQGCALSAA